MRQARYFLAAALPFLVLALLAGLADVDGAPEIFGLLALIAFLIGALRLIYGVAFKKRRSHPVAPPLGLPTGRVEAPTQHVLPPPYAPPVGIARARYDTGEVVEPPSVTEHTTRHLEHETPRDREH